MGRLRSLATERAAAPRRPPSLVPSKRGETATERAAGPPQAPKLGPEQARRGREKGLTCSAEGHKVCGPAAGSEAAWKRRRGLDGPRLLLYSPLSPLPFLGALSRG